MSVHRILGATSALLIAVASVAGCTAHPNGQSVESAAPTTAVDLPNPAVTSVKPSTSDGVAVATGGSALTPPPGGIPVCGSAVPSFTESSATSTPAPDTCSFPEGGSGSPTCPEQPTEVVTDHETRPPTAEDRLSGSPIAAFGRFGGEGGGSMCFAEYPGGAVFLSNTDRAVLLPPSSDPMRVAGRTQLARSDAVWGAVDGRVDHVELQDASRPNGVAVALAVVDPAVRVFVAPVSAGSATITAFAADGTIIQVVR